MLLGFRPKCIQVKLAGKSKITVFGRMVFGNIVFMVEINHILYCSTLCSLRYGTTVVWKREDLKHPLCWLQVSSIFQHLVQSEVRDYSSKGEDLKHPLCWLQVRSVFQHLVQSKVWDYSSMEERRSETPTMLASGKVCIPAPGSVLRCETIAVWEERRSETTTMLASGKFCIPAPGAVWGIRLQQYGREMIWNTH